MPSVNVPLLFMSQAALCKAVRDTLQETFSLDENSCQVCFDGQPCNPVAGEMYVSVHPMGWQGQSGDWDLDEDVSVGVTITKRAAFAPKDRRGVALWLDETDGLETQCRRAIMAIHQNQTLRAAANTYIGSDSVGFVTALWFLRTDPAVLRNWDWFGAAAPEDSDAEAVCGYSQTITFGRARRCQSIPDMD